MSRFDADIRFPEGGTEREQLAFLLRFAALAPSSHNTQPWKFRVSPGLVEIFIDETGWLRVADADRRELHVSIGCALENLLIAAENYGFACRAACFPEGPAASGPAAAVVMTRQGVGASLCGDLFAAMDQRQANRNPYGEARPEKADLDALSRAADDENVHLTLVDAFDVKQRISEWFARADRLQWADPAWRKELAYWVGQGVFGTPPLISKLARVMLPRLNLGRRTARQDARLALGAPILGVLSTADDAPMLQVQAGQALERLWVKATSLGLCMQPMNQTLQLPELRREAAQALPLDGRMPQIMFRMGYAAPDATRTPRRELGQLMQAD